LSSYLLRRLAMALLTLYGIATLTWLVVYVVPTDPAVALAGPNATSETVTSIRHELGLDRPMLAQYGSFLARLARLDFGTSLETGRPVLSEILERFPNTLKLALFAFVLQLAIGIPTGILAATFRGTWVDNLLTTGAVAGLSLPKFWLGVMLIYLFGYKLGWFPMGGLGGLSHMVLPGLTVALTGSAFYTRLLRSSMIEVQRQEYVTTARAKGLSASRVVLVHVMRNALVPVVTWAGMDFASFLGGMTVVEAVFGWPGIGDLTFNAVRTMNVSMIVGTVLFSSIFVVLGNLAVDLSYGLLDRRMGAE
jgi:peptide/nickel transport system permease protein